MSRREKRQKRTRPDPGPGARWSREQKRAAALVAGIAAVLFLGLAVYSVAAEPFWSGEATGARPSGLYTAAIVDQLSLSAPNPEFAEAATETLEDAGYTVDYFPGEEVTVDFYRQLPTRGYDLLILRAHSARLQQEWQGETIDEVILFTAEPYSETKHALEQQQGRLAIAQYSKGAEKLFGVAPDFIRLSMKGSFAGATVVLMGCEGLGSEATAKSFVEKGAETVISWTGLVSAAHTDAATEDLIRLLVDEELAPAEAVAATMDEVGPDPTYGSELRLLQ